MLILPQSVGFAECTDTMGTGATPPAGTAVGVGFTAGANNADGTAVTVLSALAHDCHFLVLGINGVSVTNGNGDALADILIDPAGGTSWASLIDDLICGGTTVPAAGGDQCNAWTYWPLWIPAGSSLGIRCRTAHTADITTGRVIAFAFGCPKRPDLWWCGQKVESLGITAASSRGVQVTPGNTTYSAWTTIGTSTGRYGAFNFMVNNSDASSLAVNYFWQVGAGSQKLPGTPTLYRTYGTAERGMFAGMNIPFWCDIPDGTTIQARAAGSAATEDFDVGFYGVM